MDTSEEAKDFISRLLIVNKRYSHLVPALLTLRELMRCEICKKYCGFIFPISWRMGACEALRHPWLADPVLHHRLHTKVKYANLLKQNWTENDIIFTIIILYMRCGYLFLCYCSNGVHCVLLISQKTMCRSRRSSCVPNPES